MFIPAPIARGRSFAKAVTWRMIGSLDTFIVSFTVASLFHHPLAGAATLAGSIATTETVTKVVLYFFHERIWARVRWGRADVVVGAELAAHET